MADRLIGVCVFIVTRPTDHTLAIDVLSAPVVNRLIGKQGHFHNGFDFTDNRIANPFLILIN